MKKTSLPDVQLMLYKVLSGYKPLNDAVDGIYTDSVPNDPEIYIRTGEDTVNDWSTFTFQGEEVTHTLHVFHKHSKVKCKKIMSLVLEALTQPSLKISGGFSMELSRLDFMQVVDDPEGWRHGVIRFRFLISQD